MCCRLLESPYDKSNQESEDRGDFIYPAWFRTQFETFENLGKIQLQQVKYPSVSEIPSNIIKQQTMFNPPKAEITENDVNALRNLLNTIIPSKSV